MFARRYIDRFDDNRITPPLKTSLGNGSIVESGASIVLTAPSGVDCQWDPSLVHFAPVAYIEDASVFPESALDPRKYGRIGLMGWEVRMTGASFTPVDDAPRGGLTLWWGYANSYQLSYDFSSEYIVFERMVADVKTLIADTGGNTGSPNTTPKRLKLLYNPRSFAVYAYGQSIAAGEIAAFHSNNDGVSYSYIGKETVALDEAHLGAGVFLKRSSATPTSTATATFDYLEYGELYVTKEDLETAAFEERLALPSAGGVNKHSDGFERGVGQSMPGPTSQPTDDPVGPHTVAAFEDHLEFPTAGGPPQHQAPVSLPGHTMPTPAQFGTGQVLPGAPNIPPEGTDRSGEGGSWEDSLIFPKAAGPTHHAAGVSEGIIATGDSPEQHDGGATRYRQAAYEDRLVYQLGGPPIDYPVSVNDGDSNVFIEGYQARYVVLYDPSTDAWGATRAPGDGFYGADRSGYLYHDGSACGFGDFGTLAAGVRDTAWALSRRTPLESSYVTTAMDVSLVADDTIRCQNISPVVTETVRCSSEMRWYVEGDFDVEVEYFDYAMVGGSDGGAVFYAMVDYAHYAYVRRRTPGSDRIDSEVFIDGASTNYTTVPTSVVTGKLRITRTGSTWKRYYDIGGGWVQIGTDQSLGTERVYLQVAGQAVGSPTTIDVKFKNLAVNLGTISTKIGWAAEAFGADRGNRDDFPTEAVITATDTSLEIIDATNHKLWMRFSKGTNNILDDWGGSIRPRRLMMRNGVLLVGFGDDATLGGLLRIDFNLDCVNIHQEEASTITGGHYKSVHGGDTLGTQMSVGAMRGRNAGRDWGTDHDTWKQQKYSTRAGDLYIASGYEYRASANEGGVAIFKWHRWYLHDPTPMEGLETVHWAHSSETARMYWCHFLNTGELMYMDDTYVYSVFSGTYEMRLAGGFAGIFSADQTKALAGTRTYAVQKALVPYGTSTFFLAANEGVYQIDWPTGSFIHQFGHTGSSAVHERIPTGAAVQSVVIGSDGGTPLLVLVLYFKDTGTNQLMAINLISNAVHSYTPLFTGNMQFAESAT